MPVPHSATRHEVDGQRETSMFWGEWIDEDLAVKTFARSAHPRERRNSNIFIFDEYISQHKRE